MDIRQMRVLEAVYRTGSVTAAAHIIHVTQPAISKTVRQAEELTGLALFENINSRLVPTANLHALMPQIRRMLLEQSNIGRRVDDLRNGRGGLIRIASAPTLVQSMLVETTRRFKIDHRQAEISISIASTRQIVEQVINEEVDIGTCQPSSSSSSIISRPIWLGQVVCILPKSHGLSERPFVTPRDLVDEEIISYSATEPTWNRILETFLEAGVTQRRTIEVDMSVGACAFVEQGLGLALVSSIIDLEQQFPNLCSRPFVPKIPIQAHLLTSNIRSLSALAANFCDMLIEVGLEKGSLAGT